MKQTRSIAAPLPEAADAADLGGVDGAISVEQVSRVRRRGWAALSMLCLVSCGADQFGANSGDASADASVIEGGGMDTAPPGCDASKDPKDSAACVDDGYGVFVSPMGKASGAGTKSDPLLTISGALGQTSTAKKRVYICEGTYAEAVSVSTAVNLYGGFDCGTWAYGMKPVKVAPSGAGIALTVTASGVTVEDIEFDAKDGVNPGDSSIAVFVSGAQNVLFRRVIAIGGAGQDGGAPVATANYDGGVAPSGNAADSGFGAPQQDCAGVCADGVHSTGAKGGNVSTNGADGGPALVPTAGNDGRGGIAPGCASGPHAGADAVVATGASGTPKSGDLSSSGWRRIDGSKGASGGPGQGGGGGGGGIFAGGTTEGGGGGGCGGCGGAGGVGGMTGGSSFALLSYKAVIALDSCTLKTAKAGDGKSGGTGQVGQAGGVAGAAIPPASGGTGCNGAAGGNGGAGGGGGGGAGGHSVAIGYVDTPPTEQGTVTKVTSAAGTGGAGGGGGTPGATIGSNGSNAPTLAL